MNKEAMKQASYEIQQSVANLMNSNGFDNIRTSLDLGGVQRAIIGTMIKK